MPTNVNESEMAASAAEITTEAAAGALVSVAFLSRLFSGKLVAVTWGLLVAMIAQWGLIRLLGDVWWLGTVAIFAPRWPLAVPLAAVATVCAFWRPRLLCVHFASAILMLGPVMGFCVPMPAGRVANEGFRLRVMTVNAGYSCGERLLAEIEAAVPDIIGFQELGRREAEARELLGEGWHWDVAGGVPIASRYPIREADTFSGGHVGRFGVVALRVRLELPFGSAWVCCLHLNTPRWGLGELAVTRRGLFGVDAVRRNVKDRSFESRAISEWLADSSTPTLVLGDFNMPVESRLYRRDWGHFQNAFSSAGFGLGGTKYTRWHSVRIDHILADRQWRVLHAYVGGDTGGDHRPVIADLVRIES